MILLDVLDTASENEASSSRTLINTPSPPLYRPTSLPSETDSVRRLVLPDYAKSQLLVEQEARDREAKKKWIWKWKRKRFWQAVCVAFVLYAVVSACIAIPLAVLLLKRKGKDPPPYISGLVKSDLPYGFPIDIVTVPSTLGSVLACNDWNLISEGSSSHYHISYSVPANESLTLHSNLTHISTLKISQHNFGHLNVSISSDPTQKEASVSVDLHGGDPGPVTACTIRTSSGWGLALSVPSNANENISNLKFHVSLSLPIPNFTHTSSPFNSKSKRKLKSIKTFMAGFNQTFSDLHSFGTLDSFVVVGSIGNVGVDFVSAKSLIVQNSVGNITGSFNASESLVLETVLAPISANVSLFNAAYYQCPPTMLVVETGSSDIALNVTLYDGGSSHLMKNPAPSFVCDIRTFGAPLITNFFHDNAARPAHLHVNAWNNLEPAEVFLDSRFQGTFDVRTTLSSATVDRSNVTNPSGSPEDRLFDFDVVSPNRLVGWTGWDNRSVNASRQGHVAVVSSLSPAILQLTQEPDSSRLSIESSQPARPP